MIRTLRLTNFKCFENQSLALGPISLLTGLNGMGKSSSIQALLCLQQSEGDRLSLNGDLVQIGTASDVLYEHAEDDEIGIALDDREYRFVYDQPTANEMTVAEGGRDLDRPLDADGWQYLNCERYGPRSALAMNDTVVRDRRQLGIRGEYAAHFLAVHAKLTVPKHLRHAEAAANQLQSQVDAWMGEVSPGTRLSALPLPEVDMVRLSINFADRQGKTRGYRPTNVGFGISYILPVIIAGLAAQPGSLLMVENPEAHLHPRGQARMGEFLALVSQGGVQVLLETHSDHLLNGIRLAVHGGRVPPDDVAIHYFAKTAEKGRSVHKVISPKMDRNGRIDNWPDGFFDEWDNALNHLILPAAE